jgi:hypothetical protein
MGRVPGRSNIITCNFVFLIIIVQAELYRNKPSKQKISTLPLNSSTLKLNLAPEIEEILLMNVPNPRFTYMH